MILTGGNPLFQVFSRAVFKFQFSHQYRSIGTAIFSYNFYSASSLLVLHVRRTIPRIYLNLCILLLTSLSFMYDKLLSKQLIFFPLQISLLYVNVFCMLSFKYVICSSNLVTVYCVWL